MARLPRAARALAVALTAAVIVAAAPSWSGAAPAPAVAARPAVPTTAITLLVPCPNGCTVYAVWTIVVGRQSTMGGTEGQVVGGRVTLEVPTAYVGRTQFEITAAGISPIQGEAITALALRYTGYRVGARLPRPPLTARTAAVCMWQPAATALTIPTGLQTFTNLDVLTRKPIRSYRWWSLRTWPANAWNDPALVYRGAAGVQDGYCGPVSSLSRPTTANQTAHTR